jgi:cysteine desulfurase
VGLGKACEIAARDLPGQMDLMLGLRKRLEMQIMEKISDARVNGHAFRSLPHILSVSFRSITGDAIVRGLDRQGIAASAGAACTAETIRLSHVLEAMQIPKDLAMGTVRFSLGKGNTEAQIDRVAAILPDIVQKLRALAELEASVGARGCR